MGKPLAYGRALNRSQAGLFPINFLTKRMSNAKVVRDLSNYHIPISESTLGHIQRTFARRKVNEQRARRRYIIGMGEFSTKKRHNYATVITELVAHKLVDTFERRDKGTV